MSLRKGVLYSALGPHTPRFPPVTPQKPLGGGKLKRPEPHFQCFVLFTENVKNTENQKEKN